MKWIRKWLGNRKLRRLDAAYTHGYDYAAGALMRGEKTAYDIEVEADTSSAFSEDAVGREWDRGMRDALAKLIRYAVIDDNTAHAGWPECNEDYDERVPDSASQAVRNRPYLSLVSTGVGEAK